MLEEGWVRLKGGRRGGLKAADPLFTQLSFPGGGLMDIGGGSFQNYEISYVKTHSSGAGVRVRECMRAGVCVCVCVHAAI